MGRMIADAEEMRIILSKGAKRLNTKLKPKFLIECAITQDKDCTFLDDILSQGKAEEFRTDALILHLRVHRQRRQVQTTNPPPLKGF